MTTLHDEVTRFKGWAPPIHLRHGEWECDYEHWKPLWSAAIFTIDQHVDRQISPDVAEDLLYVLARDNEAEYVRDHLAQRPSVLSALAVYASQGADADAKWQIVVSVAEANLSRAAKLIHPFLSDEDEYVRRRSLMAYARYAPRDAESIALQNLSDAFEYTRIAALHVLDMVESSHLAESLGALENDPNEYVRRNVRELREKR